MKQSKTHIHPTDPLRFSLQAWFQQRRRSLVLIGILMLFSLVPALLQHVSWDAPPLSSPSPNTMEGRGAIEGGTGDTGTTDDPPGYFCGDLFSLLSHFHFYVKSDAITPVIGVPPDYTTGNSASRSGAITTTAQDELVNLFPTHDTLKKQAVFRYDDPYKEQRKEKLCAATPTGQKAIQNILDHFYGYNPTQGTTGPSVNIINDNTALNPTTWVTNAITGFFDTFWRDCVGFLQAQIATVGFIWITPPDLSYRNTIVLDGANWALDALDGYVALLLVVGGYQLLLNRGLGLEERASVMSVALRVAFTTIIANTGFFLFLPGVIDLTNSMSMGMMAAMLHSAAGNVSLPLGAINWIKQPISWGLFILIDFVVSLFFIAVQAVRLAVLDLTIVLSPWWIMALANEYSRSWGRLGATTFFSALLVQPIQVTCVSLGSALITNFGSLNPVDPAICQRVPASARATCIAQLGNTYLSNSMNLVALILGIATLYVAVKLPGMFFSSAIRASVGSVNRDIGKVASTAMRFMLFQKNVGA